MKKQFLVIMLSTMIVATLMPSIAFANVGVVSPGKAYLDKGNVTITDEGVSNGQLKWSYFKSDGTKVSDETINESDELVITQNDSSTSTGNTIQVSLTKSSTTAKIVLDNVNVKTNGGTSAIHIIGSDIESNSNAVTLYASGNNTIQAGRYFTSTDYDSNLYHNYSIFLEDDAESATLYFKSKDGGKLNVISGDVYAPSASDPRNTRAVFSHGPIVIDGAKLYLESGNTAYTGYTESNAIYSWHKITIRNKSDVLCHSGDGSTFGVIRAYDDGLDILDSTVKVYSNAADKNGKGVRSSFRSNYQNMSVNGYCICPANSGNVIIKNSDVTLISGKARFNAGGIDSRKANLIIDNSDVTINSGEAEYTESFGIGSDNGKSITIKNNSNVVIKTGAGGTDPSRTTSGYSVPIDSGTVSVDNSDLYVQTGTANTMIGLGWCTDVSFSGETNSTIIGDTIAFYTTNQPQFLESNYIYSQTDGTVLSKADVLAGIGDYTLTNLVIKTSSDCNVRFKPNNGEKSYSVKVAKGGKVEKPDNPEKDGFRFSGWLLNGQQYLFDSQIVTEDIVLEANWINTTADGNITVETVDQGIKAKSSIAKSDVPLTEEEATRVENGAQLEVDLVVKSIKESTIAETEKELINNKLTKNQKLGIFLDLSLIKKIDGVEAGTISEALNPIKVTITIPESLRENGRQYSIVRSHEGTVEVIYSGKANSNWEISFETDKFSTYAIAYSDSVIDTGDHNNILLFTSICILALLGIALMIFSRKRNER